MLFHNVSLGRGRKQVEKPHRQSCAQGGDEKRVKKKLGGVNQSHVPVEVANHVSFSYQ